MYYKNVPSYFTSLCSVPRSPREKTRSEFALYFKTAYIVKVTETHYHLDFFPCETKSCFFKTVLGLLIEKRIHRAGHCFSTFSEDTLSHPRPAASNNASRCVWHRAFRTICFQSWNVALISKLYPTISIIPNLPTVCEYGSSRRANILGSPLTSWSHHLWIQYFILAWWCFLLQYFHKTTWL